MTYQVNNVSKHYRNYKYIVVRDCTSDPEPYNGYYYWCGYDDLALAQEACKECGNGFIVESTSIEPLSYGEW